MKLLVFVFLFMPVVALASGVDSLKGFLHNSRAVKAQFSQTVLDRNGKQVQSASGVMQFSRPGKFRWVYEKPYAQLIVGDGARVWMHDADLNQVTIKKLDQVLGSSPAALLAGDNEIERNFDLVDGGRGEGLEWVEAVPKTKDSGFEKIRIAFKDGVLAAMELRDHFGQTTIIRFAAVERNPRLAPSLFSFTPPKGADVIGD